MAETVLVAVLGVVFLLTIAIVVLRFTTVLRQMYDSMALDRRERAIELDQAHTQAFQRAMEAIGRVQQQVVDSQTAMFNRTVDMVAGPQSTSTPTTPFATDDPRLDNRPMWKPDDEWDYTGVGIDPTDDDMPDPPLEPEDNEGRAVMVRPGETLIPDQ